MEDEELEDLLDAALNSRALLQRERQRAQIEGRPADWWVGRPPEQPFVPGLPPSPLPYSGAWPPGASPTCVLLSRPALLHPAMRSWLTLCNVPI